jgi:PAS domain-containing protein
MNIKHILNSYPEPTILLNEDHRIVGFNHNFDVLVQDKAEFIKKIKNIHTNIAIINSPESLTISIDHVENNYILIKVLNQNSLSEKQEIYFKSLFSTVPVGVLLVENGIVEYANSKFKEMVNDDPIGKHIHSILNNIDNNTKELIMTKSIQNLEVYFANDQKEVDTLATFVPVEVDDTPRTLAIFKDITELKKQQKELIQYKDHLEELVEERTHELQLANELYKTISDEVPVAIWKANSNGFIEYQNQKFKEIFDNCFEHSPLSDIICNECILDFTEKWQDFIKSNNTILEYEFCRIIKKSERWFKLKATKLKNGEFVGTVTDLTSEKLTIPKLKIIQQEIKELLRA